MVKQKHCYFIKKQPEHVTKSQPIREQLFYGDLGYAPVAQLATFVDEVLVTLVNNRKNHVSWPRVVSCDLERQVQTLKSAMFVVTGQVQGKTLLPIPLMQEQIDRALEQMET